MTNLVSQLRALAKCEHSDLSIAEEAAEEIERLQLLDQLGDVNIAHLQQEIERANAETMSQFNQVQSICKQRNEAYREVERLEKALDDINTLPTRDGHRMTDREIWMRMRGIAEKATDYAHEPSSEP